MYQNVQNVVANGVPAVLVAGGSAGALTALRSLLQALPEPFPGSIVVALHGQRSRGFQSALRDILNWRSRFNATWANEGEPLLANHVHVCPQGIDTKITAWQTFHSETSLDRVQPSVTRLFESAADVFGKNAIGVVLSGYLDDGASGAKRISDAGGTIFVQDRASALQFDMPLATLARGVSALQLPPKGIATAIAALLLVPGAREWFKVSNDSRYAATA